jgi:hypothetical protein
LACGSQKYHAAYGASPRGGRLIHESHGAVSRRMPSWRPLAWSLSLSPLVAVAPAAPAIYVAEARAFLPGSRFRPRHCVALPPHDDSTNTSGHKTRSRRLCSYAAMTSTVTTPSRPLAAGSRPRRSGPAVLSLSKGGGGQRRQRRLAPSTSCAVLASPDKQSTANKLPLSSRKQEEEVEKATDYNEVAAALETIYKLSPAVEVEEKKRQGGNEDDGCGEAKKKRKRRVVSCSVSPVLST